MMADILKIVTNPDAEAPALRSVVQCLRNLADNIEEGKYSECIRAAVVLRCAGSVPIICGMGTTDVPTTYMDLHAGATQLMHMQNPERS